MISKRHGLTFIGTSALCLAAILPSHVDDGRLPKWESILQDVRQSLGQTARLTREALIELLPRFEKPVRTANIAPSVGGTLEAKQANQDATILKQAYTAAAANEQLRALGYDPTGVEDALSAYRAGSLADGDAAARTIKDPILRTALEWVALRDASVKIGMERLNAFTGSHPGWPAKAWFRHQMEARLAHVSDPRQVESFFVEAAPETASGKLALAKALKADGRIADGTKLARAVFRESDLSSSLESRIKADFGEDLTKSDYKYRADRLLYDEQIAPALRYAAQAGPDVLALARARAAVIAEAPSDKAIADVPETLRNDPGLILNEVQKLRRSDKLMEAARLMQTSPREASRLIDGDEWWTERRVLARRLLDDGRINAAYVICATHMAASREAKIEAEFHAGWIALRFMNEASRASYHFAVAEKLAQSPMSVARIAYWQGRTAEALDGPDAKKTAERYYRKAAEQSSTYYGQVARDALGVTASPVQEPSQEATGVARTEAVRVVEMLYAAGEKDSAYALAVEAAKTIEDERQLAALASVIARQQDAHLSLVIGKLISQRGFAADTLAFPTFGIPRYEALDNSAPPSIVYSIARQESAFMPTVVSKAGAKGLMQMLESTARRTATKAGVPFDGSKLLSDASFNARLGAAHLGELLAEQNGSYILTFAAYNAGGGRVKQWIEAYGDPRQPGVDQIDWVERIPFTETRNYVQRVMANVRMYDALLDGPGRKTVVARTDRQAKL